MKYFLTIFLLCFCLSALVAQEKHFVFIQSDNSQPFYVSLNGKLYSSTSSGYIIIPKFASGTYNFFIGFAQNAFPEQSFQLVIDNKDLGFNLKNFGEKGWGLFDLQSLAVTMAAATNTNEVGKVISEKAASNDDEPIISFDRKKKDTSVATKSQPDPLINEQAATNEKTKAPEAKPGEAAKENNTETNENNRTIASGEVKKVLESKDEDGVHLSYTEDNGKTADTIHVIIPSDRSAPGNETGISSSEASNATGNAATSARPAASESATTAKDNLKFLDVKTNKSKKDAVESEKTTRDNSLAITNSKCTNIATDQDYARLRKKMAKETTDEEMIDEARKMYQNKCFTTEQIKKLSTLFLSDEGRYNFFNASYNSAADISQYSILQSEFIDPAFVNRFKAMLK